MDDVRRLIARLAVAVATADGRITAPELDALERLEELGLGPVGALALEEMEHMAERPLDLVGTCAALTASVPDAASLIVTALAEVAASDEEIASSELELLQAIGARLGLAAAETAHVLETVLTARVGLGATPGPCEPAPDGRDDERGGGVGVTPRPAGDRGTTTHAAITDTVERACTLLGVGVGAGEAEVSAAYRALVERYDPAKVLGLGPEFTQLAVRKLALVTDAYEIALAAGGREASFRRDANEEATMIPRTILAREIMTRDVQTCGPDEPLSVAAQLMRQHGCGCIPVVDADGRPLAMVTDRDICMVAEMADKPLSALRVRDAMSTAMHACRTDDSLAVVERMMREYRVHRLPVVDRDDHVVGLLSVSDLAREAAREHVTGVRAASADGVTQTLAGIVERQS